jgi:copper chaperone CopZ
MVVRTTISRIEGVKSVEANPVAQTATIVYDDTKTNPQVFVDALKREGQTVMGQPKIIK